MVIYNIFYCLKCKTPIYCPKTQKTKQCPICHKRITLKNVNILKSVNKVQDAIYIVQNLKLPNEVKQELNTHPKKPAPSRSRREKFLDVIREFEKKMLDNPIDEKALLEKGKLAGFSEKWIIKHLFELEKSGHLIRPQKNHLKFII